MIDRTTVERIKNTADIVDVVSDYVHLIRKGANYMGLCPFHNERTPSFSVNRQRNFCYCFSCKKGGSPVNFIMEKEGLSYHEALLHLAKKYGIEVVEKELTDEERRRQSEREAMFVANEWAMQKMEKDLTDTEEGRDVGLSYFTQRGVTDAAMKAFHLGYAIDKGSDFVDSARRAGFKLEIFKQLGLIGTSAQGHDYGKFRGRVIFPIINQSGKVIAFGGRDLKGGLAKYINSPESELYKKSNELYGIFQAKSSIIREDKCFLVEGYMDVIGMWQSGMKNVVASSGTALTDGQIAMIHRYTPNITLIYDGDNAGIKASLRGIDMLLNHGMNVKVMLLPDGDDPDSFARKHTPEEFAQYVAEHETDIIRYKAKVMLDMVKQDPQTRIEAINSVVTSIAHIPDQVARDVYVQECSQILNIPEATIAKSVARERVRIEESQRRERTRRQFPVQDNTTGSNDAGKNDNSGQSAVHQAGEPAVEQNNSSVNKNNQGVSNSQVSTVENTTKTISPLYPLERNLMRYCARYAYLPFCTYDATPENEGRNEGPAQIITLNVLEYVVEELRESQMEFSNPVFSQIMDVLTESYQYFEQDLSAKMQEIDLQCSKMLEEGRDRIRQSDYSVSEIKREEEKLAEQIELYREGEIRQFSQDYPGRILSSHEDSEIRKISVELIFEKHNLSNIYLKDGQTELEPERLEFLVPRAINEWKNEIINLKIKDLISEYSKIYGHNQADEEQRLQNELNSLMAIRAEIAKLIGERILGS